ncbi:AAA family ATPase [Sulfurimonas sp.]|uniref:AAA family ATPase n=1 Tax=Sulfurimonas sp. TaxID=2022749 RepID=UPI002AB07E3B|nr:AAA family ATPase [Sulfurimonas sp.]
MTIDKDEIEKYIFDPQNPQQCKSYKLLLNIAKQDSLVYVSPDFVASEYADLIINNSFKSKLWDIPENFNNLTIIEKINLYKKSLSIKEYIEHIDSLHIDSKQFKYNKIFTSFIDLHPSLFIKKMKKYNSNLLSDKLYYDQNYSFAGYTSFKSSHSFVQNYFGHKIFFTNNMNDLDSYEAIIDISSIVVTSNNYIYNKLINDSENIKPIYLKKLKDIDLLLEVLENDLKKEKSKNIKKEDISTIDKIKIKNFFSIKDLQLDNLKDKKEIYILGENGDGKTLLLQAIAIALKGVQKDGQERFRKIKDEFELKITNSNKKIYKSDENIYKNMFAYGSSRNNNCQIKDDEVGYLTLFDGSLDLKDPVKWLQLLDYSESKNENNIISVVQAKKLIQELLNKEVEIDISPTDVIFTEKGSKQIEFDRLSAGYKGVITIICDMLVRLSENQPYIIDIKEYQGIVLIDEVELHLHPIWKYDFMNKLRGLFPLIQFIVTTHSPTVILGASKEAVFYKIYKEDGEVCISNQMLNEGYTNNSLISSPLFDLKNITSRDYDKRVSGDDYIYDKIHQVISKKIEKNINIDEEEILKLIDEELDKI